MKEFLLEHYGIEVDSLVRLSQKTYKVSSDSHSYLLKANQKYELETIIKRLEMLNIETFVTPIPSLEDEYIIAYEDDTYALYPFYEDDANLNKDIRVRFYLRTLAFLHTQSSFKIKGTDHYFEETYEYLEKEIKKVQDFLLSRIKRVERDAYHSPSDWFFLVNYERFMSAIKESKKELKALQDTLEEEEGNLCLTYRNFDYRHINVKRQKIVSLDKMTLGPCIYDLFFLFEESFTNVLDPCYYLKEYLALRPLSKYEAHELLSFLFIPKIERKKEEEEDIKELLRVLNYLQNVFKVQELLFGEGE